ncbi:hypothetical protein IMZ11_33615 [Microtetraspora sp. AC03309]|uniref:hypothetical protein n=1 Tax=Microtetraspora sp. AC03309 TaxID=2779376 RepID=UPI001E50EF02|nr:hypothetical protein [Microtetraspora sp. AC03309]MCC5580567.1 hypothetical protein [Microtetraspora sp. AC03309]
MNYLNAPTLGGGTATMMRADAYLAVVRDLPAQTAQADRNPAATAARRLQRALRLRHEILTDVHQGDRVAFVSVAHGLLVVTNGRWYRWPTGERDARGPLMAQGPASDPITAADRVAERHAKIMKLHPPADPIPDSMRNPI